MDLYVRNQFINIRALKITRNDLHIWQHNYLSILYEKNCRVFGIYCALFIAK